jgi:hypothetical protein
MGPHIELTYGPDAFSEIRNFLEENHFRGFTLSVFDVLSDDTVEVECDFDEIVSAIAYISNVEHDFPNWIGVNLLSQSYVVGLAFGKGCIPTHAIFNYKTKTVRKIFNTESAEVIADEIN